MITLVRIVHLEDDAADAELAQAALQSAGLDCHIMRVETREDYCQAVAEAEPDVILADYRLPTFDGVSALRLARELCPGVPFIFVSGTMGEDAAIEALTGGATDYVLKGKVARLAPAVKRALSEAENARERKRAEVKLRDREGELAAIYENTPFIIMVVDSQRRVRKVNGAAREFAHATVVDLLGRRGGEALGCLHAQDDPQGCGFGPDCPACTVRRTVLDTFETGQSHFQVEASLPFLHDGAPQELTFLLSTAKLNVRDGPLALVTIQDITERKRAENKLAELQAQLTHASRLATLGELAAGVVHEVNQPLCTIVNFAKACKNMASGDAPDLSSICQWSETIAGAAARSGDIVRRMLTFARAGDARRAMISIEQLVSDAILLVRHEARSRRVELRPETSEQDLAVYADSVRIHQVLVNLLRNAIESFTEASPADRRVVVRARRGDGRVQVSVSDNGPGPPEAESAKIFEPFFTTKPQGLGIGLAISRRIIEDHGGRIWAEAAHSGGLTIHFTLATGKDGPQDVSEPNGVCH